MLSAGRVITKRPYGYGSIRYNADHHDEWASHFGRPELPRFESRGPRKLKPWGSGLPKEKVKDTPPGKELLTWASGHTLLGSVCWPNGRVTSWLKSGQK